MRVSTSSGSLRVTITSGFLRFAIACPSASRDPPNHPGLPWAFVQVSLTTVPDTGAALDAGVVASPSDTEFLPNRWTWQDKRPRRDHFGLVVPKPRNLFPQPLTWERDTHDAGLEASGGDGFGRDGRDLHRNPWQARKVRSVRRADCRCRGSSASSPTGSTCAADRRATMTSLSSIRAPGCRSRSSPNPTTGAASAIGRRSEGWVYHSLLSGRRTAVVIAEEQEPTSFPCAASRRRRRCRRAGAVGRAGRDQALHRDVVPHRRQRASTAGSVQEQLWGVYPHETVE